MTTRKLPGKWRYMPARDLGLDAEHMILQFKYAEKGWASVGECHASTIPLLQRDGVKAHAELLKMYPHVA